MHGIQNKKLVNLSMDQMFIDLVEPEKANERQEAVISN